ncbi:chaplin [Streptomyces sp. NPDC048111]|uniref:chaplin n=1 Tax=Streptomyces sp. NPDC048111 TaxID=3365500 RepID=UPI0037224E08
MVRIRTAVAATVLTATAVLGTAGVATADPNPPTATGTAQNSPGVLSGDVIQVPIGIPINVCGDSIDIIGLLNPAFGNSCRN